MTIVLAMVVFSSKIASADTKTLVCKWNGGDTPLVTIDLNEAQGTATYNTPAWINSGIPIPATSTGQLPAKFDPKTVTFDQQIQSGNATVYMHYTLDRVTGLFSIYESQEAPFDQALQQNRSMSQYTCHVATAQF